MQRFYSIICKFIHYITNIKCTSIYREHASALLKIKKNDLLTQNQHVNFDHLAEVEGRSVFVKGYISSLEKESDPPLIVDVTTIQVDPNPVFIPTNMLVEPNAPSESTPAANGKNQSTVHHTVDIFHTVNAIDLSEDGGEKEDQSSITRQTFFSVDHPMGATTTHTVVTHVSSHVEGETEQIEPSREVEQAADMPQSNVKTVDQPEQVDGVENDKQEAHRMEIENTASTETVVVEVAQDKAVEEVDTMMQQTDVLQETPQEMKADETQPQTTRIEGAEREVQEESMLQETLQLTQEEVSTEPIQTEETEQQVQEVDFLQETPQDESREEELGQTGQTEESAQTMQKENELQQITQKETQEQTIQTEEVEQEVQLETNLEVAQQPQADDEPMTYVAIFTEEERAMLEEDQVEAAESFSPPPVMEVSEPGVSSIQQATNLPSLQQLMQMEEQLLPHQFLRPMTQTTAALVDERQEDRPNKRQRLESSPSPQASPQHSPATPTRSRRKRGRRESTPFIGPIFLRRSPRLMNKKRPQYFPPSGRRKYKKKSQGH